MAKKAIKASEVEIFFIKNNKDKGIKWLVSKLPALPENEILKHLEEKKPEPPKDTLFKSSLAKQGGSVILTEAAAMVADEAVKSKRIERNDCIFKPDENKRVV